ncbi:MAG: hypothetical protein MJ089_09065 [Ruminococcus sp.]|nr:hypothetical protein [Ruminococcus sp.]
MKYIRIIPILLVVISLCSCGVKASTDEIYYGQTKESTSAESKYIIEEKRVVGDSYIVSIPNGYTAKENKGTIVFESNSGEGPRVSVEEYIYAGDDLNAYINRTLNSYRQIGADVSDAEIIIINEKIMNRYEVDYVSINAYAYFVDLGDEAICVSVISEKDSIDPETADGFVEGLNIL